MKKVSVILIDWSVRESFHAIDCLNKQTIPRSDYEIVWIEYYNHHPEPLRDYAAQGFLDKWLVLNKSGMYRKHLMYNEGIVASEGEIVVIPDSDAMFSPTFIESIIATFNEHKNEDIVLYLDEVRSRNRRFYPFRNVSWETVMTSPGLINWDSEARKPRGLSTEYDIIHQRNYGACFCAKRKAIIKTGGFDEHSSYDSFLCGPYELGWRMVNAGFREIWHQGEWLLHAWHPWVREGI
ncbi:glycosyltransferase, partial [Chloroflexota bacterium]